MSDDPTRKSRALADTIAPTSAPDIPRPSTPQSRALADTIAPTSAPDIPRPSTPQSRALADTIAPTSATSTADAPPDVAHAPTLMGLPTVSPEPAPDVAHAPTLMGLPKVTPPEPASDVARAPTLMAFSTTASSAAEPSVEPSIPDRPTAVTRVPVVTPSTQAPPSSTLSSSRLLLLGLAGGLVSGAIAWALMGRRAPATPPSTSTPAASDAPAPVTEPDPPPPSSTDRADPKPRAKQSSKSDSRKNNKRGGGRALRRVERMFGNR
ncbi:MAG: hypothetical protein AAGF11_36170 [Myxococcota bacterium]